ncbi:MAG: YiiX/YebB-like N1pC/P60 family cysteine hydrolase [Sulfurimonas sp.]|jgi:hypothetical protein
MYVFDIEKLQESDILLTAQRKLLSVSTAIRVLIWSRYSHAMMYVGNYSFIHAVANGGVKRQNIQHQFFKKSSQACVLRVKNAKIAKTACEYAKLQVHTQYSVREAIRTKLELKEERNRQFCSRLVAEAYAKAGLSLVKNSSLCSPQELYESSLTEVISGCLREATSNDLMIKKTMDTTSIWAIFEVSIFEKIRIAAGEDIQNTEDLLRFLMHNPHYDDVIVQLYKDEDYFNVLKSLNYRDYHHSYEALVKYSPKNISKENFIKEEMQSIEKMIKECQDSFELYQAIENYFKLNFATMMKNYYQKELNFLESRLKLCREYTKKIILD